MTQIGGVEGLLCIDEGMKWMVLEHSAHTLSIQYIIIQDQMGVWDYMHSE